MTNNILFWDFHGTLTEPDSLWSRCLHRAILAVLPDSELKLINVRAVFDNDGFPWHHPERDYRGLTDPDAWWEYVNRLFYTTLNRLGISMEQACQIVPLVRPQIIDSANFRLISGADDVLRELKRAGWRHVMLSNNFPELPQICDKLGIADHFDHFVVSAAVGYEKPHPEIFRIALERSGNPQVCYMIGDNPIADITGAQAAGIPGILVNQPYPEDGQASEPVHRCENLCKLIKLLRHMTHGDGSRVLN